MRSYLKIVAKYESSPWSSIKSSSWKYLFYIFAIFQIDLEIFLRHLCTERLLTLWLIIWLKIKYQLLKWLIINVFINRFRILLIFLILTIFLMHFLPVMLLSWMLKQKTEILFNHLMIYFHRKKYLSKFTSTL